MRAEGRRAEGVHGGEGGCRKKRKEEKGGSVSAREIREKTRKVGVDSSSLSLESKGLSARLSLDIRLFIPMTTKHRIFTMSFASVYPHYVAKAERKGRTKSEVDEIICWLTGYTQRGLEGQLKKQTDFETFFKEAPQMNPSRTLIKGVVCGVRVEDIEDPTMREIRYLDKLVDELAKGKQMEKILRGDS